MRVALPFFFAGGFVDCVSVGDAHGGWVLHSRCRRRGVPREARALCRFFYCFYFLLGSDVKCVECGTCVCVWVGGLGGFVLRVCL